MNATTSKKIRKLAEKHVLAGKPKNVPDSDPRIKIEVDKAVAELKRAYKSGIDIGIWLGYLTLLFFLVVTPVGIIMRISGKDILDVKCKPDADTYWIPKKYSFDKQRCEKQF